MPGSNAGTGQPHFFRCAKCRKAHGTQEYLNRPGARATRDRGSRFRVTLTGRVRERPNNAGIRNSRFLFQYKCDDCQHVGWSRHAELERKARAEGIECERAK